MSQLQVGRAFNWGVSNSASRKAGRATMRFALFLINHSVPFWKPGSNIQKSLINNQQGRASFKNGTSQVGSKGRDWSLGSIQDPWYARLHPRTARSRAFLASILNFQLGWRQRPGHRVFQVGLYSISKKNCHHSSNQTTLMAYRQRYRFEIILEHYTYQTASGTRSSSIIPEITSNTRKKPMPMNILAYILNL